VNVTTPTENTLERVATEFSKEVLADLLEGRAQALARLDASRREALEATAKIVESGNRQADSLKRQTVGSAELESRNLQLREIEASVNEVFETAIARLAKADSDREKAVTRLITEGQDAIGTRARVFCNSRDRRLVSSVIEKLNRGSSRLTLDKRSIDSVGGVVLSSADGTVRFDNTFEARLERLRPLLRKEVADLLTGGRA